VAVAGLPVLVHRGDAEAFGLFGLVAEFVGAGHGVFAELGFVQVVVAVGELCPGVGEVGIELDGTLVGGDGVGVFELDVEGAGL
jgi:hypothetical protein